MLSDSHFLYSDTFGRVSEHRLAQWGLQQAAVIYDQRYMLSELQLSQIPPHIHVLMYAVDWASNEESMTDTETIIHEVKKSLKQNLSAANESLEITIQKPFTEKLEQLDSQIHGLQSEISKISNVEEKLEHFERSIEDMQSKISKIPSVVEERMESLEAKIDHILSLLASKTT